MSFNSLSGISQIPISLGSVTGVLFCSFGIIMFPWVFIILVVLCWCLHIWINSHLSVSVDWLHHERPFNSQTVLVGWLVKNAGGLAGRIYAGSMPGTMGGQVKCKGPWVDSSGANVHGGWGWCQDPCTGRSSARESQASCWDPCANSWEPHPLLCL